MKPEINFKAKLSKIQI